MKYDVEMTEEEEEEQEDISADFARFSVDEADSGATSRSSTSSQEQL